MNRPGRFVILDCKKGFFPEEPAGEIYNGWRSNMNRLGCISVLTIIFILAMILLVGNEPQLVSAEVTAPLWTYLACFFMGVVGVIILLMVWLYNQANRFTKIS